jgi:hypothetical protein
MVKKNHEAGPPAAIDNCHRGTEALNKTGTALKVSVFSEFQWHFFISTFASPALSA